MNRDLSPADLLPAISNVAGGLVVSLVLAEAARLAAEQELAGMAETVELFRGERDAAERAANGNGRHAGARASSAAADGPSAS